MMGTKSTFQQYICIYITMEMYCMNEISVSPPQNRGAINQKESILVLWTTHFHDGIVNVNYNAGKYRRSQHVYVICCDCRGLWKCRYIAENCIICWSKAVSLRCGSESTLSRSVLVNLPREQSDTSECIDGSTRKDLLGRIGSYGFSSSRLTLRFRGTTRKLIGATVFLC